MFTDSHCHLTFDGLAERLPEVLAAMRAAQVSRAMTICTTLEEAPQVLALAQAHAANPPGPDIWAAIGVHPDNEGVAEPTVDDLVRLAAHPRVLAVGETGLDYYQMQERKGGRSVADLDWQRQRFHTHIRAAQRLGKPLVIHTRAAADDTLAILRQQGQGGAPAGGVFHCFTETQDVARAALDMGFYISFSGIITFKTAQYLRDVAAWMPLDRLLIETDSPYLAPVPHRGKTNSPAFVPLVAAQIAAVRGLPVEAIAEATQANFDRLFQPPAQTQPQAQT